MEIPDFLKASFGTKGLPNKLMLSEAAKKRIQKNRSYLENKINSGETYYGINTGFGSLCNVRIANDDLSQLQENLVCSHACGMGNKVPKELVKLMLLLKIHGLSQGYSGVRLEIVEQLVAFYNNDIIPVVFEQGSLGASGDLAPLAHLSLPLFGQGKVYFNNEIVEAKHALDKCKLQAIPLAAKEGLALLNGTQFMSSFGTYAIWYAQRLLEWANCIAAISADAYLAKNEPFQPYIHKVRPHKGQIETAAQMLSLLAGSELQQQAKEQVQDPYSFRCIPQVHGASSDVIDQVAKVMEIEINSVTDNPIVFDEEDVIVSGGNFHGQPLALQLDFLAIAMAELANISERRTYLLISGQRGLAPFLAPEAGLNSGFMIAQYTAASIVSQNKQYCTPASVDSIVSSNGQEDHVSMGANAATKLFKVLENVQRVLAIELITAVQAIEFRRPLKSSEKLEHIITAFRKEVGFMHTDRLLHDDLIKAEQFLNQLPSSIY
jgi:histidine ammonia-lyase